MKNLSNKWLALGAMFTLTACSDDGNYGDNNGGYYDEDGQRRGENAYSNAEPGNNASYNNAMTGNNAIFIPELEEDFEFSRPAVVGDEVFIANETLNSVAIIDSTSLSIRTLPVGFRPTEIVGPGEGADDDARVVVLNKGSDSVSIIDPETQASDTIQIMPGANKLLSNEAGTAVIAWFSSDATEDGDRNGDLSSVTLIQGGEAHQVAVGFNVRRVEWTSDGERALVLSDDGVSILDVGSIDSDRAVPPTAVLPSALTPLDPTDLEVQLGSNGAWAIARQATFAGVVLTNLETGEHHIVRLPEIPTDLDLARADQPEALIMLRNTGVMIRASVPDGVIAAAAATAPAAPLPPSGVDMGVDADMGANAPQDADMSEALDMAPDMSEDTPDMRAEDMHASSDMSDDLDMGADMAAADMAPPVGEDMSAATPEPFALEAEGVEVVTLDPEIKLGAAAVSGSGTQALIYTTIGEQRRALLYDLRDGETRPLRFEKGLKAVIPDELGATFIIFHTRVDGEPPVDASPSDPAFIARSWGLSVVDVLTASPRLVLTQHEPWVATRWSVSDIDPRVYVIFKRPREEAYQLDSHRDVLGINLLTFSIDSFRVPSLPEGIGAIPSATRVYINQKHPQGRMTFVDVLTNKRQTVTGYQLNANID